MAFVINYVSVARQVVNELVKRGSLEAIDSSEMAARVETYKDWLETYVIALLFEELERRGSLQEFVRLEEGNSPIRNQYLTSVIPDYDAFLRTAVNQAGNALLGKASTGTRPAVAHRPSGATAPSSQPSFT